MAQLPDENWHPGDQLVHREWGTGLVIDYKEAGENSVLVAVFESVGRKEISVYKAPIEKKY